MEWRLGVYITDVEILYVWVWTLTFIKAELFPGWVFVGETLGKPSGRSLRNRWWENQPPARTHTPEHWLLQPAWQRAPCGRSVFSHVHGRAEGSQGSHASLCHLRVIIVQRPWAGAGMRSALLWKAYRPVLISWCLCGAKIQEKGSLALFTASELWTEFFTTVRLNDSRSIP